MVKITYNQIKRDLKKFFAHPEVKSFVITFEVTFFTILAVEFTAEPTFQSKEAFVTFVGSLIFAIFRSLYKALRAIVLPNVGLLFSTIIKFIFKARK